MPFSLPLVPAPFLCYDFFSIYIYKGVFFMSRNKQVSETHLLGLLLAVVGGFLDAYTYLCRGRVFANAQTGNIVLLGVNLTEQNWNRAFYYLMPILAFVSGILVCEIIQTYFKWKKKLHWRQLIVLIEIFCLIAAGFLPSSFNTPVNIMISFVCALQVEAFRKMNGNTYATTMCTGNLRSASQQLYLYITTRQKSYLHNCLQYYNVILFFILGAGAGSFFTNLFHTKAVWLCAFGLLIAFIAMFFNTEKRL